MQSGGSFSADGVVEDTEDASHNESAPGAVRRGGGSAATAGAHSALSPSTVMPAEMHMYCTMSEYGGGVPSPLTIEICSFVSKIDKYDAAWYRWVAHVSCLLSNDCVDRIDCCSHKMAAIDRMVR